MRKSRFIPYYIYRFLGWRLGFRSPFSAVLKVTSDCNLKCLHCPWVFGNARSSNSTGKDIPKERWFEIIKDARDKGCIMCIIEGGEPLLRHDLGEIIDFAKEAGMLVSVITNGTMDLSGIRPDSVWVSVDGSAEVHDRIRGRGVFANMLKNLKRSGIKNILSLTTLSKENMHDIEGICRAISQHVKGMWFNFAYPYEGFEELSLTKEERIKAASEILSLKRSYNIINSDSFLESVGMDWTCRPWITLNVGPDGTMHHGCTVEQLETCECGKCDMSCYGELSKAYDLNWDSIEFLKRSIGARDYKLLWLRNG